MKIHINRTQGDRPDQVHSVPFAGLLRWCFAWALVGLVVFGMATSSMAAAGGRDSPLEIKLVALTPGPVVDGKETLVPAPEAKPGQILVYRVTYHNRGEGGLKNVVASVPLPEGVAYVDGSAAPAAGEASLDGKAFFPVAHPPENAPPASWKEVRWSPRPLAAGAAFTVELRARVTTP